MYCQHLKLHLNTLPVERRALYAAFANTQTRKMKRDNINPLDRRTNPSAALGAFKACIYVHTHMEILSRALIVRKGVGAGNCSLALTLRILRLT